MTLPPCQSPDVPKKKPNAVSKRHEYDRDEIAPLIIQKMVEGQSLRSICEAKGMPAHSTFLLWVSEDQKLADQYARAREALADAEFDRLNKIADDAPATKGGVDKARLQIDTRKWWLGKIKPKKYGEPKGTQVAVQVNNHPPGRPADGPQPIPLDA
ncbi:MAG: hypothetical protein Rubg2KO_15390 [Rubricoccaceae bacterium]